MTNQTHDIPEFDIHPEISEACYQAFRAITSDGRREDSDAIVRAVIVASTFHADPVLWEFEQRHPETQQWETVQQRERLPPGSQVRNERALIYRHAVAAIEPVHAVVGYVDEPSLEAFQSGQGRSRALRLYLYAESESVQMPVRLALLPPDKPVGTNLEDRCRQLEAQLAQARQHTAALSKALVDSTTWMRDCVKDVLHPVAHLATSLGAVAEGLGGASVDVIRNADLVLADATAQ